MLKDRWCGICCQAIEKGEKYAVITIPKNRTVPFLDLTESEPDLAARISQDPHGNLRLAVCLVCHLHIFTAGVETLQ
jgi:hypothetical protein